MSLTLGVVIAALVVVAIGGVLALTDICPVALRTSTPSRALRR